MSHHIPGFLSLSSVDEVDDVLTLSATRPILIFKHSATCGTSAFALEEVRALIAGPPLPVDVYLVDVRAHRAISHAIATRLHVRHESPQALLVRDGAVLWHSSHFRVTADAIAAALTKFATPAAAE